MSTVKEVVPHYKSINRDVAKRLGYVIHMLELPEAIEDSVDEAIASSDTEVVSPDVLNKLAKHKKAFVLRDPEGVVCYYGKKITPVNGRVFEINVVSSEEEVWERDTPDYYHDLGACFSLLKSIPCHSIRLMTIQNDISDNDNSATKLKDIWELSYRPNINGETYTESGPFLTIIIVNAFLECNEDAPENELSSLNTEDNSTT